MKEKRTKRCGHSWNLSRRADVFDCCPPVVAPATVAGSAHFAAGIRDFHL
jgi:hypothetical protein